MVKVSLNSDKQTRIEQAKTLQDELEAELISIVGKTASFVKDL
jgi:RNA-binding protein YhbY